MAMLQACMLALNLSLVETSTEFYKSLGIFHGNASSSYAGSPSLSGGDIDQQNSMGIAHDNASSSYDGSHSLTLSLSLSLRWRDGSMAMLQAFMLALNLSLVDTSPEF